MLTKKKTNRWFSFSKKKITNHRHAVDSDRASVGQASNNGPPLSTERGPRKHTFLFVYLYLSRTLFPYASKSPPSQWKRINSTEPKSPPTTTTTNNNNKKKTSSLPSSTQFWNEMSWGCDGRVLFFPLPSSFVYFFLSFFLPPTQSPSCTQK